MPPFALKPTMPATTVRWDDFGRSQSYLAINKKSSSPQVAACGEAAIAQSRRRSKRGVIEKWLDAQGVSLKTPLKEKIDREEKPASQYLPAARVTLQVRLGRNSPANRERGRRFAGLGPHLERPNHRHRRPLRSRGVRPLRHAGLPDVGARSTTGRTTTRRGQRSYCSWQSGPEPLTISNSSKDRRFRRF